MYSRTFPSAGSQRTFRVLVVGSITCRFLTKPRGSERRHQTKSSRQRCCPPAALLQPHSPLTSLWKNEDVLDKLTGPPGVGQAGSVSLGVDRHHGDGVAGVGVEFIQHRHGGALRHLFLQTDMTTCYLCSQGSCDLLNPTTFLSSLVSEPTVFVFLRGVSSLRASKGRQ